jgi:long-subunit acyl-CoA synthetase (AMP-forming)
MAQIQAAEAKTTGLKKTIYNWGVKKSKEYYTALQWQGEEGKAGDKPTCFGCAHALVLKSVKEALGLDKCRLAFSSSAPLSKDVVDFFGNLNIPIYDVYGQTESTGPCTSHGPGAWKAGTTGKAMEGVRIVVDEDTGELLFNGRNVFMG